VCDFAAVMAK